MKNKKGWKYLGSCGVDSGQLLVTDPCYLEDWEANEFEDKRVYKDKQTGKLYEYRVNFENFESVLFDKKTVNQLILEGRLIEDKKTTDSSYSYNGACQTSIDNEGGEIGIRNEGVVFRTGIGDGVYPVYARIVDGRVAEIRIDFLIDDTDLDK